MSHWSVPADRPTVRRREDEDGGRFPVFALVLSFGLAMLGLMGAADTRPDAATGDPFLFVLRL